MKIRPLQELCKVLAGVVLADLVSVVWLSQQHFLPVHIMGFDFSQDMVVPTVIFDLALFIVFIHYAWHIGTIPRLRERAYLMVAGVIFSVVAAAHLMRIFANGNVILMGWAVPLWLSWVGVAITAYLAYTSFVLATRVVRK